MKHLCPHCGTCLHIRTSRAVSLTSRELYVRCPEEHCAYTGKAILSIISTIAPSINPNPLAYLPVGRTRVLPNGTGQLSLLPE